MVTDLNSLLDALHVEQADVLGFSTGGLIAQRLALTAPAATTPATIKATSAPSSR